MNVALEYQLISGDEYVLLFRVRGEDFETFEAALAEDPTVSAPSLMIETESYRVYRGRLVSAEYLVLSTAVELGLRLLEAQGTDAGWYATLEVPEMAALQAFRDYCGTKEVGVSIQKLYHTEEQNHAGMYGLTPQQRVAIVTAYEMGYFNQPRDSSLQMVADALGVSPSAASGRLRRGLRALVKATVSDTTAPVDHPDS